MILEFHFSHQLDNVFDLLGGRVFFHDDDHFGSSGAVPGEAGVSGDTIAGFAKEKSPGTEFRGLKVK
jgi:hypothetical protein